MLNIDLSRKRVYRRRRYIFCKKLYAEKFEEKFPNINLNEDNEMNDLSSLNTTK